MRHVPTHSRLAIGDASKLSSHDQVLCQTKKKMPRSEDIRIRLNRPKSSDLRRKLEETKAKAGDKAEPIIEDLSDDLRIQLRNKRAERATFLNARNRRRVQVILARPSSLSDKEEDAKVCNSQEHPAGLQSQSSDPIGTCDLRSKLKRKSHAAESMHAQSSTCLGLNESRATASDPV
ncbi:hypothetical protein F2Q68_00016240 [Brassica cretica]|uniref:Uncharacterized protein n=1 Tax=Brassica cretica TaxID=69181 RepID=A0A8S9HMR8_BRACR|nr:hypothetical protein F2Q68_00016240 [Brassica cretica]